MTFLLINFFRQVKEVKSKEQIFIILFIRRLLPSQLGYFGIWLLLEYALHHKIIEYLSVHGNIHARLIFEEKKV